MKKNRTRSSNRAWAIEIGSRPNYFGKHNFRDARVGYYVPSHTAGCRPGTFENRREARTALRWVKGQGWPKARVVRVSVTVTTIGRG